MNARRRLVCVMPYLNQGEVFFIFKLPILAENDENGENHLPYKTSFNSGKLQINEHRQRKWFAWYT